MLNVIFFCQMVDLSNELNFRLPVVRLGGKYFRVMVSVINLDPKPVHRIANWVKRKEEWLQVKTNPNTYISICLGFCNPIDKLRRSEVTSFCVQLRKRLER